MKRSSSGPRGYLRQLAAPLPHAGVLLRPRRPVARGAGSILDAIPPVVDSVRTIADYTGAFDPLAGISAHAPPNVLSGVRSTSTPRNVQSDATSVPVTPNSVAARPTNTSGFVAEIPQPAAARSPRTRSAATGEAASQRSTRLDPEAIPQLSRISPRPSVAEPSSLPFVSSSARPHAEANRDRGVQVHIGAVEVRIAAPPPPRLPQPSADQRRVPISNHAGRPAHAESLSRGLAWSHGLVQG